jgi:polar amino acid transport system substrate-binding protein
MKTLGYGKLPRAARRLACAMPLLAGPASAAQITVHMLAQEGIPPRWILENGKVRCLCPDLVAAIERIEPRIRFTGHQRGRSLVVIENALASGRIWAACGMLDPARRRSIALRSEVPVFETRHRMAAVATDIQVVNTLDELVRFKPLINTARGSHWARVK